VNDTTTTVTAHRPNATRLARHMTLHERHDRHLATPGSTGDAPWSPWDGRYGRFASVCPSDTPPQYNRHFRPPWLVLGSSPSDPSSAGTAGREN
jgi:hypothetical protein